MDTERDTVRDTEIDWETHRHKEGESGITAKEREKGRD